MAKRQPQGPVAATDDVASALSAAAAYLKTHGLSLGSYVPGGDPTVRFSESSTEDDLEDTARHEGIHRALTTNTAYGHFLLDLCHFIGPAEAASPEKRRALGGELAEAIRLVADASRLTQEGVATFVEFNSRMAQGALPDIDSLPDLYREALKLIWGLVPDVTRLPLPLAVSVGNTLAVGIGSACLNSPIRRDLLERGAFSLEALREYLAVPGNTPDRRLRLLGAGLAQEALRRVELLELRFGSDLPIRAIAERWKEDPAHLHYEYARARDEYHACLRDVIRFHHPDSEAHVEAELERALAELS